MQRFFIQWLETTIFNIKISDVYLIHQIIKVLRAKLWDKFIFFNWEDFIDYIFELKEIEKKYLWFEQVWRIEKNNQSKLEINLFQAIPNKIDKIESIIKNWTQIWISNFLFFRADRSQKLNIVDKKIDRLRKIILEASEQCSRNIIPEIIFWDKPVLTNLEWKNIFLHTQNKKSELLRNLDLKNEKVVNIFIGPEWGFSDDEVWKFERNNFERIFLWDNILRTELTWISTWFYIIQNNLDG